MSTYHSIRYANGSWQSQGFASLGVPAGTWAVFITAMPDGSSQFVDVVLSGSSFKIYHDVRYANGSWQREGWAELPNPNTELINPGGASGLVADIAGMPNGSSQLIFSTVG